MSRIGKHAIAVPSGVAVDVKGQAVSIKGKLGQLGLTVVDDLTVTHADHKITIALRHDTRRARMVWGTYRSLVNNMVKGVTDGFKETLEIEGVGFRASVQGKDLVLQIGFSHEVKYPIPDGIAIKAEKPTLLSITGIDKRQVGQVTAEIRGFKRPEPYKGKGIRYTGEVIRRKEGKKK